MKKLKITDKSVPIVFFVFVLVSWEFFVILLKFPQWILPSPSKIIFTLYKTFPLMTEHIKITFYQTITGFTLAIIFAFVIAFIMDNSKLIKNAVYPFLVISQTVPIITIAPLLLIWFGYGVLPKILIVILVCFFPICINLLEGLASVDKEQINLLKSMGAGKNKIFTTVKLPASMPSFFSGLKISAAYSVMGAVIGEWVGAKKGIGVFMTRASHSFAVDRVFAAIIVITLMSIAIFKAISIIEKLVMPWKKYIIAKN